MSASLPPWLLLPIELQPQTRLVGTTPPSVWLTTKNGAQFSATTNCSCLMLGFLGRLGFWPKWCKKVARVQPKSHLVTRCWAFASFSWPCSPPIALLPGNKKKCWQICTGCIKSCISRANLGFLQSERFFDCSFPNPIRSKSWFLSQCQFVNAELTCFASWSVKV